MNSTIAISQYVTVNKLLGFFMPLTKLSGKWNAAAKPIKDRILTFENKSGPVIIPRYGHK